MATPDDLKRVFDEVFFAALRSKDAKSATADADEAVEAYKARFPEPEAPKAAT